MRFGPFVLDCAATRLLREGVEVRLRPQALQALKVHAS
jgi:DNA-binding winged helix-turn-helix (wHTH) protein